MKQSQLRANTGTKKINANSTAKHQKRLARKKLFIITGPSAVGKTSIAKLVLKKTKNLIRSLTFTSREIRKGEKNGQDYHFISKKEFQKKIRKSDFLEYANNYGNFYGTDKKEITNLLKQGKNVLVVIDIKGAISIKKKMAQAIAIFILPESTKQLEQRFKKRKDTSIKDVKKRLKTAKWELLKAPKCDYWVINQEKKIELAVEEILEIIGNA